MESRLHRWLNGLIRPGCDQRAVDGDARRLLEAYGPSAYQEARTRARNARMARGPHGRAADRRWSRVARVIARLEGREIGLRTSDRYGS